MHNGYGHLIRNFIGIEFDDSSCCGCTTNLNVELFDITQGI